MIKIWVADDESGHDIEELLRTALTYRLWAPDPFAEIKVMTSAHSMLTWLSGENPQLPDVAALDIDFRLSDKPSEKELFSKAPTRDEAGKISAQLGWWLAAAIRHVALKLGRQQPRMFVYSGKAYVFAAMGIAAQPPPFDQLGPGVRPFIDLKEKGQAKSSGEFNIILDTMKEYCLEIAKERVREFRIDSEVLDALWLLYGNPKMNAYRLFNDLKKSKNKEIKAVFELFPFQTQWILAGNKSMVEARKNLSTVLNILGSCDHHWELCRAFKTLNLDSPSNSYATPLAAACHAGQSYKRAVPDEALIQRWLETECTLPPDTKDRIRRQAEEIWEAWPQQPVVGCEDVTGPLTAFGCRYSDEGAPPRAYWESTLWTWIEMLETSTPKPESGSAMHQLLLTDWEYLFANKPEQKGVFTRLINRDRASVVFSASRKADCIVLTVEMRPVKHIVRPEGFKGGTADLLKQLEKWGETYYEFSKPPEQGGVASVVMRYYVYPPLAPHDVGAVAVEEPVFRVVWTVYDYLNKRTQKI